MGTDNERNPPNQSQQSQSQSQSQQRDDLTKPPLDRDEVGGPSERMTRRDIENDDLGYADAEGQGREPETDTDAPRDRLQDHDKLAQRDRDEELKRQQRDQQG